MEPGGVFNFTGPVGSGQGVFNSYGARRGGAGRGGAGRGGAGQGGSP